MNGLLQEKLYEDNKGIFWRICGNMAFAMTSQVSVFKHKVPQKALYSIASKSKGGKDGKSY